jgi:hypothetical protein
LARYREQLAPRVVYLRNAVIFGRGEQSVKLNPDGAKYGFPLDATERDDGFGIAASWWVHSGVPKERRK